MQMKSITTSWESMKNTIDWTAFSAGVSYTLGWIGSHLIAILSGVWLSIQIYTWIKHKKWRKEIK